MKAMHLVAAGSLIVALAVTGIYAVAATAANAVAASFTTDAKVGHTRSVEFATTVQRLSAEHRAARAKCKLLSATKKKTCSAPQPRAKETTL